MCDYDKGHLTLFRYAPEFVNLISGRGAKHTTDWGIDSQEIISLGKQGEEQVLAEAQSDSFSFGRTADLLVDLMDKWAGLLPKKEALDYFDILSDAGRYSDHDPDGV